MITIPAPRSYTTTQYNALTMLEKKVWESHVETDTKKLRELIINLGKAYTIAWDQCTAQVKANTNYESWKESDDVINLMKEIQKITYQFQDRRYLQYNLYQA